MRNNSLLILEIVWIVTGLLALGIGIKLAIAGGNKQFLLFFLMSAISFLFAWFRHSQRKKN